MASKIIPSRDQNDMAIVKRFSDSDLVAAGPVAAAEVNDAPGRAALGPPGPGPGVARDSVAGPGHPGSAGVTVIPAGPPPACPSGRPNAPRPSQLERRM